MTEFEKLNTFILKKGICSSITLLSFWKNLNSEETSALILSQRFEASIFKRIINKYCKKITNKSLLRCLSEYFLWKQDASTFSQKLKKAKINVVSYFSELYPISIKYTTDPPLLLFYRGDGGLYSRYESMISIVGTRDISKLAVRITKRLVWEASLVNACLVSGMAQGVDIQVWQLCHLAGITSIAVIPFFENYHLSLSLTKQQLILSEVPPFSDFEMTKGLFVQRNRLIAGMSLATIVIQAPIRSGALYTSQTSLSYGRSVYFYIASISDFSSYGQILESIKTNDSQFIISMEQVLYDINMQKHSLFLHEMEKVITEAANIKPRENDCTDIERFHYYGDMKRYLWKLCQQDITELTRVVIELKRLGIIFERKGALVFNFLYSPL